MQRDSEVAAGPVEHFDEGKFEKAAFRISDPDAEGHRFIAAPEPGASGRPPASDVAGRYAREGA